MNRDEGCIGNKIAIWCKKSTGIVQAFFDIRGNGCLLERLAHRLRDAHKPIGKESQKDGVGFFGTIDYDRRHLAMGR